MAEEIELTLEDIEGATLLNELPNKSFQPQTATEAVKGFDLEGAIQLIDGQDGFGELELRIAGREEIPVNSSGKIGFLEETIRNYKTGNLHLVKAAYGRAILDGTMDTQEALEKGNLEHLRELQEIGKLEDVSYWENPVKAAWMEAAKILPSIIESSKSAAVSALAGGSIGAVTGFLTTGGITSPALAAAGLSTGGIYGVIKHSIDTEGMNLLFDMVEDGASREVAIPLALAAGTAIGVIELFKLKLFSAGFRKLVVKAMNTKVGKSVVANAISLWIKNAGIQTGQEALQSTVSLTTAAIASIIERNPNVMPSRGDIVKEFKSVARSFGGMLILNVPSGAAAAVQQRTINQQEVAEAARKEINDRLKKEIGERQIEVERDVDLKEEVEPVKEEVEPVKEEVEPVKEEVEPVKEVERIKTEPLNISKKELNWIDWAIDAMEALPLEEQLDIFEVSEFDEKDLPQAKITFKDKSYGKLTLSEIPTVNEELLFRLEDQAPSVIEQGAEPELIKSELKVVKKLADKIRTVIEKAEVIKIVEPTEKLKKPSLEEEQKIQEKITENVEQPVVSNPNLIQKDKIEKTPLDTLIEGQKETIKRKDIPARISKLKEDASNISKQINEKLKDIKNFEFAKIPPKKLADTINLYTKLAAIEKERAELLAIKDVSNVNLGVKKVILKAKEVIAFEEGILKARIAGIITGFKKGKKITSQEIRDVQNSLTSFILKSEPDLNTKVNTLRNIPKVQTVEQLEKAVDKIEGQIRRAAERLQKRALVNSIKEFSKPKKLEKVSSDFLPNINAILNPFSVVKPTVKTTAKLVWLAKELRESNRNQITQDELAVLQALDRKPLIELELRDLELIHDSVAHLLHLNTQKQKDIKDGRTAREQENLEEAVKNIEQNRFEEQELSVDGLDDMFKAKETEIFKGVGAIGDLLGVASYNTELLAEILDGKDDGIIQNILYRNIDVGTAIAIDYRTEAEDFFISSGLREIIDKSWSRSFTRFKSKVKQQVIKLESGQVLKINKGRKISLLLHARNENNIKHLLEGGVNLKQQKHEKPVILTKNDIRDIVSNATKDEIKVADVLYQFFNTLQKNAINEVTERRLGYSVATEPNYFPLTVITDSFTKTEEFNGLSQSDKFIQATLEGMGIFKRRRNSGHPIILNDAFDIVTDQLRKVSNFVGLAEPLAEAKSLVNSAEFRNSVTKIGKGKYIKSIEDYINKVEGSMMNNDEIGKLASNWQQRIDIAVLAGNIGVFFKQPVSFVLAASEINARYMVGSFRPASKKLIAKIRKYSSHLRERLDGNITLEVGEVAGLGAARRLFLGKRVLGTKLMIGIRKFDETAIASIWRAVEKETKKKTNLTPDSDAFYEHVASRAWQITRRTQPTFDMKDRSYGGRVTNTWFRLGTKYMSQRNKNWMIQRRAWERYNRSEGQDHKALRTLIKNLFLLRVVAPAMIAGINVLRAGVRQDDDDEWFNMKQFAVDWLVVTLGDVYFIGSGLDALISTFVKDRKVFGMTDPLTKNFENFFFFIGNVLKEIDHTVRPQNLKHGIVTERKERKERLKRMQRQGVDVLSKLSGVPVGGYLKELELAGKATGLINKKESTDSYRKRNY